MSVRWMQRIRCRDGVGDLLAGGFKTDEKSQQNTFNGYDNEDKISPQSLKTLRSLPPTLNNPTLAEAC